MIYKNMKTGAVIDSPCTISGGDWELQEPETKEEAIEEPETKEEAIEEPETEEEPVEEPKKTRRTKKEDK